MYVFDVSRHFGTKPKIKVIQISIGLMFMLAGLLKMTDLVLFEETIVEFNVLPRYSKLFSIIIPSFEVVAGACLVIGIFS